MDDKLIAAIESLGADALTALYIYIFLDYTAFFVFLGLCTWGIRTFWKAWKDHEWGD